MIEFVCQNKNGVFDVKNQKITLGSDIFVYPIKWTDRPGRLYIIFSTRCNIRCSYCFQNTIDKISTDISIDEIFNYITYFQNDISEIVLFGGEPLLKENYKYIVSVIERFDYFKFIIFTNGNFESCYRDLIEKYSYCIQSVIITLDGSREIHNKRRVNPVKDSYQLIMENLFFLADKDVVLDVQMNVDIDNAESFHELMREVSYDSKLKNQDYTLNPVKYIKNSISYEELLNLFFDLREKYPQRIFVNNRLITNLLYLFNGRPLFKHRCGLDRTYVISLPHNVIYSCPQNPSSISGYITDGKIFVDSRKIENNILSTQYKRNKCIDCDYSYLCPYCCPYVPEGNECVSKVEQLLKITLQHFDLISEKIF